MTLTVAAPHAGRGSLTGRILIVEDEADLANMIRFNLEREGFECEVVLAGDLALQRARAFGPTLVLLDRMLPGLSGDQIASQLKKEFPALPVIMLTARVEEADQLMGFALGADDYVTKPFSIKLLLARVGAVLRRAEGAEADQDATSVGPISLVPSRHEVKILGEVVELTATEFRLLQALMNARGRVLTRAQLLDRILGANAVVTDRTIDVHVTALRKKMGPASSWIKTIRGVGYTFRCPD